MFTEWMYCTLRWLLNVSISESLEAVSFSRASSCSRSLWHNSSFSKDFLYTELIPGPENKRTCSFTLAWIFNYRFYFFLVHVNSQFTICFFILPFFFQIQLTVQQDPGLHLQVLGTQNPHNTVDVRSLYRISLT